MDKRMVDQEFHNEDTDLELSLRPTQLKQYIGQSSIKSNLEVFIKAAKLRQEPLDHVLLFGPPGLGKTTLSNIIANEMEQRYYLGYNQVMCYLSMKFID